MTKEMAAYKRTAGWFVNKHLRQWRIFHRLLLWLILWCSIKYFIGTEESQPSAFQPLPWAFISCSQLSVHMTFYGVLGVSLHANELINTHVNTKRIGDIFPPQTFVNPEESFRSICQFTHPFAKTHNYTKRLINQAQCFSFYSQDNSRIAAKSSSEQKE